MRLKHSWNILSSKKTNIKSAHTERSFSYGGDQMYVRDLEGNEYACQVTITQPQELNGNRSLTATILPSKVNKAFIDDIAEMWEIVDHDDVVHKIVYAKRSSIGNLPTVEITATPVFFDKFDTSRV